MFNLESSRDPELRLEILRTFSDLASDPVELDIDSMFRQLRRMDQYPQKRGLAGPVSYVKSMPYDRTEKYLENTLGKGLIGVDKQRYLCHN